MNELGLGFSTLQEINKVIIMTSITHFGQTGPYKNYESCDLVDMAMSGYMYLAGDIDRPPVRIGFPQAYLYGGLEASAGTLIAFHHRCLTGEGQWVDVAIRDSLIKLCHVSRPWWDMNRVILKRMGPLRAGLSNALVQREMWPCKEGTINFYITGGLGGARSNRALVQWVDEEGVADDFLRNIDWDNFDVAAMNQETQDELEKRFSKFFAGHRSDELYEGAKKRRILLHPVTYIKDLAENQQLQARSFWEEVNHPELGESIIYPGMWVKCPEQPLKIRKRPPLIGEHNQEVYSEIGLQERDLVALKENNVI